jgi:hypothetical protein
MRTQVALFVSLLALAGCSRGGLPDPMGTEDGGGPLDLGGGELGAGCAAGVEFGCEAGLRCDPCTLRCVPPAAVCTPDGGAEADLPVGRPACRAQPGLGACYSFEEDGALVGDGSGNGNDGTLEGGGWRRAPGKFGGGLAFDGLDGRVHVRSSPTLDFKTGATVEFWMKVSFDPMDTGTVGEVASRGTGNGDDFVAFWTTCGNGCGVWQHAGTGTSSVCSFCGAARAGAWSYVAIVNDGKEARSYVDGILRNTQPGGRFTTIKTDLFLGRRVQGIFSFKGVLDELRWWTVARSEAEICADGGGAWTGAACVLP